MDPMMSAAFQVVAAILLAGGLASFVVARWKDNRLWNTVGVLGLMAAAAVFALGWISALPEETRGRPFYWCLAILPALIYPAVCWSYWKVINYKRLRILHVIGGVRERHQYVQSFAPAPQTEDNPFSSLFDITYNLQSYVLAVAINMAIVIMAAALTLIAFQFSLGLLGAFESGAATLPRAVLAGIAGAYVFGIFDILRSYRSADLSAITLHFIWLRIVVVAVLSAVSGVVFTDQFGAVAAFGMGVFPLLELFGWVRGLAEKQLGGVVAKAPAQPPSLHNLQGMTPAVLERLGDEGIDSVQSLAFADPVRLLLRTNFEWKVILDYIDQAFLYLYLQDRALLLRDLGVRGAIEFMDTWDALGGEEGTRAILGGASGPDTILHAIASRLGQSMPQVQHLLRTIVDDFHIQFIRSLWGRLEDPAGEHSGQNQEERVGMDGDPTVDQFRTVDDPTEIQAGEPKAPVEPDVNPEVQLLEQKASPPSQ